jgi:hypothetical protein
VSVVASLPPYVHRRQYHGHPSACTSSAAKDERGRCFFDMPLARRWVVLLTGCSRRLRTCPTRVGRWLPWGREGKGREGSWLGGSWREKERAFDGRAGVGTTHGGGVRRTRELTVTHTPPPGTLPSRRAGGGTGVVEAGAQPPSGHLPGVHAHQNADAAAHAGRPGGAGGGGGGRGRARP